MRRFLPAVLPALLAGAALTGAALRAADRPLPAAGADWAVVGGEPGASRFSSLTQIDRGSVAQLRPAWTYHTGELDVERPTAIECAPVVVDGTMYVTTALSRVVALDAATGRERWKYEPYPEGRRLPSRASGGVNRGLALWPAPEADGRARPPQRVFLGAADGRLISLDVRTGRPDPAFDTDGEVDLRAGSETDLSRFPYGPTSAPVVFEDLVVLGFSVSEGPGPGAPGDLRAFDARTGREAWRFRTVPRPGEFGAETWPADAWKDRSGANAWGGLTVDARRGIVFAGTGSASFDFFGGDRRGDNLFANCSLALDARTGKRLWHFQTVRHDLWDYDNPYPPVVVTVRHEGRQREAVAQVTKTGFVFLLDRLTGKPLFPVEERPAPGGGVPGEEPAAKQLFPLQPPPLARQGFSPDDITDLSSQARAHVLAQLRTVRYGPIFTPPSLEGTVISPGFHGGATWSGAAFDPTSGTLYVNTNDVPWKGRLLKAAPGKGWSYDFAGYERFTDHEGFPAIKPPWGHLTAVDLNRGTFRWRVPLGHEPALQARGVPQTGCENFGGCIVTAGGLVFIGATKDEQFHAFDKDTGRLLWETRLPAGGYAQPCTYAVDGRQYVAIAAGGGGKLGTKRGDAFVAYTLP